MAAVWLRICIIFSTGCSTLDAVRTSLDAHEDTKENVSNALEEGGGSDGPGEDMLNILVNGVPKNADNTAYIHDTFWYGGSGGNEMIQSTAQPQQVLLQGFKYTRLNGLYTTTGTNGDDIFGEYENYVKDDDMHLFRCPFAGSWWNNYKDSRWEIGPFSSIKRLNEEKTCYSNAISPGYNLINSKGGSSDWAWKEYSASSGSFDSGSGWVLATYIWVSGFNNQRYNGAYKLNHRALVDNERTYWLESSQSYSEGRDQNGFVTSTTKYDLKDAYFIHYCKKYNTWRLVAAATWPEISQNKGSCAGAYGGSPAAYLFSNGWSQWSKATGWVKLPSSRVEVCTYPDCSDYKL
mmetsp:Transcript_25969/g.60049  ORF Transcript_25969/g.60049 Transcript_25969/m.60049 type:complete len:349 (+) Transcript_25969:41-1087(+)